ncbi:MAG: hypothetical protein LBJ08_01700 [Bifidobacteriaceae bacterium]|nr:hypothetical protein [Bifidobacteriaceae bacterium]
MIASYAGRAPMPDNPAGQGQAWMSAPLPQPAVSGRWDFTPPPAPTARAAASAPLLPDFNGGAPVKPVTSRIGAPVQPEPPVEGGFAAAVTAEVEACQSEANPEPVPSSRSAATELANGGGDMRSRDAAPRQGDTVAGPGSGVKMASSSPTVYSGGAGGATQGFTASANALAGSPSTVGGPDSGVSMPSAVPSMYAGIAGGTDSGFAVVLGAPPAPSRPIDLPTTGFGSPALEAVPLPVPGVEYSRGRDATASSQAVLPPLPRLKPPRTGMVVGSILTLAVALLAVWLTVGGGLETLSTPLGSKTVGSDAVGFAELPKGWELASNVESVDLAADPASAVHETWTTEGGSLVLSTLGKAAAPIGTAEVEVLASAWKLDAPVIEETVVDGLKAYVATGTSTTGLEFRKLLIMTDRAGETRFVGAMSETQDGASLKAIDTYKLG